MRLTVSNVLGVSSADIALPGSKPIGIIGPNAAGKSSIAAALAALLARDPNPLRLGVTKSYMREGADYGEAALHEGPEPVIQWILAEKGLRVTAQAPAQAAAASVGLIDFVGRQTPRTRTENWEAIFLPAPETLQDLMAESLRETLPNPRMVDDVMETLREQGWEAVENVYKRKAVEAKRVWAAIAGEPYGKRKAPAWKPVGWRSELDGVTRLEAEQALQDAREAQQAIHVARAVSASQAEAARAAAERLPTLQERLGPVDERLRKAEQAAAAIRKELEGVRSEGKQLRSRRDLHDADRPRRDDGRSCPHCGQRVVWDSARRTLLKAETDRDFARRESRWEARLKGMDDQLHALRAKAVTVQGRLRPVAGTAEGIKVERAELAAEIRSVELTAREARSPVRGEGDDERAAAAEQRVQDRIRDKELVAQAADAADARRSVDAYAHVADTLGPRGIRARAMKEGLGKLAANLKAVRDRAGWPPTRLDATYAASFDGRATQLCSTSEQWRAQASLILAVALTLGDGIAILDGADVLDETGRLQLFGLCDFLSETRGLGAVVCATGEQGLFPEHWAAVTAGV